MRPISDLAVRDYGSSLSRNRKFFYHAGVRIVEYEHIVLSVSEYK